MNDELRNAFDFIDGKQEEMLGLWESLVNTESGSYNKKGIDNIANKLENILKNENFVTNILNIENAGNSLIAESKYNNKKESICIIGHMDTVFEDGTVNKRPFTIMDGKAYGPGVIDMKGGIVVLIYAIKALNSINYRNRPLKIILLGDEEIAHANSNIGDRLIKEFKNSIACFNCETGYIDDAIVIGRKGAVTYELMIKGISAHSGNDYEKGRSAILEMAHKIVDIENLTDLKKGTTYTVAIVKGGTRANIIPEYSSATIGIRFLSRNDLPKIQQKLERICKKTYVIGTTTNLTQNNIMYPMEITEGNQNLFEIVKKTALLIGLKEPYAKIVGGGSDSSYSVIAGVPTICALGVKGENNHTENEYGEVKSLFERTKLLVASILNLES